MIRKITDEEVRVISQLDDQPEGNIKEKFDESAINIQQYINEEFITWLTTTAAADIGMPLTDGFDDCQTILQALVKLYNAVSGNILGQIPDGSIGYQKLRSRAQDGTGGINSDKIALGGVEDINIATGAVTEHKYADNSIPGSKLKNYVITADKLADLSVTNNKVVSINGNKIQDGTIPFGKLGLNAVVNANIADNTILERNIPDNEIPFSKLKNGEAQAEHKQFSTVLQANSSRWTVQISGVTNDSLIIVCPAYDSRNIYTEYEIWPVSQGANSITFEANATTPTSCNVNIAVFN